MKLHNICTLVAIMALAFSIFVIFSMYIGGLVTYAPGTLTPDEMQNVYLERMYNFGATSIIFQLIAIILFVLSHKFRKEP